ncbi:hypothetical protein [Pseudomonas coronafaciens]|uniref:hypothetical protein n=1 Tax=Pseudomonas coronafaciens TaxID=53409 RepID=UPI0006B5A7E4|nr:hypothetical protein [Pseudomonas coronafaciens]KPB52099.1 Uncharacterized protein AC511_0990 [Pseudomonas coronafaciens pv. oryzae]
MLPYIATYLLIACMLAVLDRLSDRPLFIRTHLKHLPWKLNYNFRWWRTQECCAALIQLSLAGLFFLLFWNTLGGAKGTLIAQGLFLLICVSSSVLSIKQFQLIKRFKAHVWWMTGLAALGTVALSIVASAYADSLIVNWTRIEAAQFPLAQKALSALILVALWGYVVTVLISLSVGIVAFSMTVTQPAFMLETKKKHLKFENWNQYKPGLEQRRHSRLLVTIWSGAAFTVAILLNSWVSILGHAEEGLQDVMIFASFHLHPEDCGIQGRTVDTWAALVAEGRTVIATPAAKGYSYETMGCKIQPAKPDNSVQEH